jgi:hypothetical protein
MESYNWTAAFTAFIEKTSLEDIALTMAIPLATLKEKAYRDGWKRLASRLGSNDAIMPARADVAEEKLAKLEANRARNLEIAQKLQKDLLALVDSLVDGTLTIAKTTSLGTIVQVKPSIKDRVDLANYAKTVAEASYRALGDAPAAASEGGHSGQTPVINVILPIQIAAPRAGRAEVVASHELECKEAEVTDARLLPSQGSALSGANPFAAVGCPVPMGG